MPYLARSFFIVSCKLANVKEGRVSCQTAGVRDVVRPDNSAEGRCSEITGSETCQARTGFVPQNNTVLEKETSKLGGRKRAFEEVS